MTQGANNQQSRTIYRKQLAFLLWWCLLNAIASGLLLVIVVSPVTPITGWREFCLVSCLPMKHVLKMGEVCMKMFCLLKNERQKTRKFAVALLAAARLINSRPFLQVLRREYAQFVWYAIKLLGYTCIILVRFDSILGEAPPSNRRDAVHLFLALVATIVMATAVAQETSFGYVPPLAVFTGGSTYLLLHLLSKKLARMGKST